MARSRGVWLLVFALGCVVDVAAVPGCTNLLELAGRPGCSSECTGNAQLQLAQAFEQLDVDLNGVLSAQELYAMGWLLAGSADALTATEITRMLDRPSACDGLMDADQTCDLSLSEWVFGYESAMGLLRGDPTQADMSQEDACCYGFRGNECCSPDEDNCNPTDANVAQPPQLCRDRPSWPSTCPDATAYDNPLYGLSCNSPSPSECGQMYTECFCPATGNAIDNWGDQGACEPDASGAAYATNALLGVCSTCDDYQAALGTLPKPGGGTFGFMPGDFECELHSELRTWRLSCEEGVEGAVSGNPCPVGAAASAPYQPPAREEGSDTLNCGHGTFDETFGTCVCDTEDDPNTEEIEELKCWQTNRERSNRYPNGNIKVWCSVGLCDFDQSGNVIVSSSAQEYVAPGSGYPGHDVLSPYARQLGVSVQTVYIVLCVAIVLFLCVHRRFSVAFALGMDGEAQDWPSAYIRAQWNLTLRVRRYIMYSCLCGRHKGAEFDSSDEEYEEKAPKKSHRKKHGHHHRQKDRP